VRTLAQRLGSSPSARVASLALLLALLAAVTLIPQLGAPPLLEHPHIPWWVLLPTFAASELFVVHLEGRQGAHSVSLREVPIVVGLVLLTPGAYVVAVLAGTVGVLWLVRGQRGQRLLFNTALLCLESAIAVALYRTALGPDDVVSVRGWGAASLTLLVTDLVSALAITGAMSLQHGRLDTTVLREAVSSGLLAALTNASLAVLVLVLLVEEPTALVALLAVYVTVYSSYRGYAMLSQRYARLELLYEFTRRVGRSLRTEQALEAVLGQTRELLHADAAEAVLFARDGKPGVRLRVDGPDGGEVVHLDPEEELPWWAGAAGGRSQLLPRGTRDVRARTALAMLQVRDAMAVPLRSDDQVTGVLAVYDRSSEVSTFTPDDLRVFEALANHASVAVTNGWLLDQLRAEAADKEHQALHDALTGLPNRVQFRQRVDEALSTGGPLAVLLLDLDRFQEINDAVGHAVGDELLQQVAQTLAGGPAQFSGGPAEADGRSAAPVTPARHLVARLGGDEFAVLLPPGTDGPAALATASELLAALDRPVELGELCLHVSASCGIALAPAHGADAQELLQHADVAMYAAKAARTGVVVYQPEAGASTARRLTLATDLRAAVAAGDIAVHYQPKADAHTGAVVGVEVLSRWSHPAFGQVSPDEFVAIADHTGTLPALTTQVLETALAQRAAWATAGQPLGLAVNVSVRDLVDPGLPARVAAAMARTGVRAGALTLEITEGSLMEDPERTVAVLRRLSALGVRLSIDDFGTGYSSLAYLRHLPVDEVKIDKSFVLSDSDGDRAIIKSTVDIAHSLGLSTVAEGVETLPAWSAVAAAGCDVVQGYLLSRPLPAAAFWRWLLAHEPSRVAPRAFDAAPLRPMSAGPASL